VVYEKKVFKWPYPIFALLLLSLFEEDLDLNLNKLEFPSCNICLYQVSLKLARCFILKDAFQYTDVMIVSPIVFPNLTLGDYNLYKLKSALCHKSFHVNLSYYGSVHLEEKKIQWPRQMFAFVLLSPPFEEDLALYLSNLEFHLPKDDLYPVWLKLPCWFCRRIVFQYRYM
jgi:hypothetical protein